MSTYQHGKYQKEIKLLYVIDRLTSLPVFFRYIPGNIIDVTTLQTTLKELNHYNISINHLIADAGYCSHKNIQGMLDSNIPFLTRLSPTWGIYKELVNQKYKQLHLVSTGFRFNDRIVHCCREKITYNGSAIYAYIFLDANRNRKQAGDFEKKIIYEKKLGREYSKQECKDFQKKLLTMGIFTLISPKKMLPEEVLPLYYTRQKIEQLFDIGKNQYNLIPLRVHSTEAIKGHLLLCFMVLISYILSKEALNSLNITVDRAYLIMRDLFVEILQEGKHTIKELQPLMRDIVVAMKLQEPENCSISV
jgi:transposase